MVVELSLKVSVPTVTGLQVDYSFGIAARYRGIYEARVGIFRFRHVAEHWLNPRTGQPQTAQRV